MSVENGPGEGTWSVFALQVVEQRDGLQAENSRLTKALMETQAELASAKADLERIYRLPELEWAQVNASLMMRLSTLARSGDPKGAQALRDVLDRGKTYVDRMRAERDVLRAACQAVADWWDADGISGNKNTDEVASKCRAALANLKEKS